MPIVPLRGLGAAGVVTDVDPSDLPVANFTFAKNVRFNTGKVERGSVFRFMGHSNGQPIRHLISYTMPSGAVQTMFQARDGYLYKWEPVTNALSLKSPVSGWTASDSSVQVTSCVLNNVVYVNRPDRVPWYRSKDSDGNFALIPVNDGNQTQWRSDMRCRVLRSLKGVLIAANITKGPNSYPQTVKWSNFSTELNMVPPDWDYGSTVSNAGENTLAEMEGGILDAFPLRNRMYLYAENETWLMEFIGGNDMFRFDRQFDRGTMGVNCTVEYGGVHYVFGTNDLWMHDGTGDASIANEKVRSFIYRNIIKNRSDDFFVTVNPRTNEIIYCFVSGDPYCKWDHKGGNGCNRAAIYNTTNKTWTFADLPYVTCAAMTIPVSGQSFDATAVSYQSIGGSFASLEAERKLNLTFGGVTSSDGTLPSRLRTFEPFTEAAASFPLDAANAEAFIERTGLDMDELKANLRGYKLVSSVYPQGRFDPDAAPLVFTFGTSDHSNQAPFWGDPQTFSDQFYKLDFNQAGRFLAFKIHQTDFQWFSLAGMDIDVTLLGQF